MKTMYYYYVLAVLGAVFSLNSCDTIESAEKIDERNRAATTEYLANFYGRRCDIEEISICHTETLSAKQFTKDIESLMEIFSDVANKRQMNFLIDMKRRLKGQPTIILYSFDVKYTSEFNSEKIMEERLYGLYNARSKEFVVDDSMLRFWDENIPKIYGEIMWLKEELQK